MYQTERERWIEERKAMWKEFRKWFIGEVVEGNYDVGNVDDAWEEFLYIWRIRGRR